MNLSLIRVSLPLWAAYPSFDETYTIEGSFGLDVDFDANVASFVDVDATLFLIQITGGDVRGFSW